MEKGCGNLIFYLLTVNGLKKNMADDRKGPIDNKPATYTPNH